MIRSSGMRKSKSVKTPVAVVSEPVASTKKVAELLREAHEVHEEFSKAHRDFDAMRRTAEEDLAAKRSAWESARIHLDQARTVAIADAVSQNRELLNALAPQHTCGGSSGCVLETAACWCSCLDNFGRCARCTLLRLAWGVTDEPVKFKLEVEI